MLIKLTRKQITIRKDSMPVDTLERLCKYLYERWVTFAEDSNTIVITAEPDKLYEILYRLTIKFDIELM